MTATPVGSRDPYRTATIATAVVLLACVGFAFAAPTLKRASLPRRADPVVVAAPDPSATPHSISSYKQSSTWRAGMVRALELTLGLAPEWQVPPAGRRLAVATPAMLASDSAHQVDIKVISFSKELEDRELTISGPPGFTPADFSSRLKNVSQPITFAGVFGANRRLTLEVVRRGFFGSSSVIAPTDIAVHPGLDTLVLLVARDNGVTRSSRLRITVGPLRASQNSVASYSAGSPMVDLHVRGRDTTAEMRLVHSAGRYTFLIVAGTVPIVDRIQVTRTDSAFAIGTYAHDMPIMAAAANGYASLMVKAHSLHVRDEFYYDVYSASGSTDVARELVLQFLGGWLAKPREDATHLTANEIEQTVRWLLNAFGTSIRRSDVEALAMLDSSLARHRDALMALTRW